MGESDIAVNNVIIFSCKAGIRFLVKDSWMKVCLDLCQHRLGKQKKEFKESAQVGAVQLLWLAWRRKDGRSCLCVSASENPLTLTTSK